VQRDNDPRFWFYSLLALDLAKHYYSLGGGVRQSVKFADFPNDWVYRPDLPTQRQIADFLDRESARIDLLIEKKQQLVKLLGERFEALLSRITQPQSHDDTGWVERPIKAVCTIFGRIGFRGYTTEDIVEEGHGAITLSPSNVKDGQLNLENLVYLSWDKYFESPEIQVSLGDIIFVKTGSTIGKVAKVDDLPEKMTLNPQMVVLKKLSIDSDFLVFAMQSKPFQHQVSFNRFGGSTPAMSQGHLGRLRVWFPEEQSEQVKRAKHVVEERKRLEAVKYTLNKSILRLKEYRSALITAAVTGQIDNGSHTRSGATDRRLDAIQEEMSA
jgi:type I restriction enzyme S subunit